MKAKAAAAAEWLREANGGVLPPVPAHIQERWDAEEADDARHLSLRVPGSLYTQLAALADEEGETVSQLARTLIADGLNRRHHPDRDALDAAIAALQKVRRDLPLESLR